jgi:AsmA family/AsmA-like C-terminal region
VKKLQSQPVVLLVCALLLALFFVRPPASRLRGRVLGSIGAALGRNVEVSSVHMRFLPRPGFELDHLVIHENAAFGAEPLLRAPNVTAWLQMGALLQGRIEIATLSLHDGSLNLTRNQNGAWNFEDLLERTSKITVAPTAASRRASQVQFPYIESTGTRINFKAGPEKTHFALTDTKLALWQESENTWGMRLGARPIRTDANLTDTGVINVSGTWQRSTRVHETPLQFAFEWKQAQIGQISKLISGTDKGWRGGAQISGEITGTPEKLQIAADTSIDDFGRRDVLGGSSLRLAGHCSTTYSLTARILSNLDCTAPSGNGVWELTGNAAAVPVMRVSDYDLRLLVSDVPAQSVLTFLRHTNPNLAGDSSADGRINASFKLIGDDGEAPEWQGGGQFEELRLISTSTGADIQLGTVPFSLVDAHYADGTVRGSQSREKKLLKNSLSKADSPWKPEIELGPLSVAMGRNNPLQVHAVISRSGYEAVVRGDAGIRRLLQSASILGLPAPAVNAEGASTVDLKIAGSWNGERPTILGTAQLHAVYAQVRGVNGPLSIAKANLNLEGDSVRVLNLNASAADANWQGSLRIPRPCTNPTDCEFQFNLHADEVSTASLNRYFNPALLKRSWYKFLSLTEDRPRFLMQARANGKISIDKLLLGRTTCSHLTTGLRLDRGRVTVSGLNGKIFGGMVAGDWEANFNARPPKYAGKGELAGVSLDHVAELMHDGWVAGSGDAKYEFTASGWSVRDLLSAAELNAEFFISDGIFPHVVLTSGSGPLGGKTFSGNIGLHEGEIAISDAKLVSANSVYTISGTASLAGELNLKITAEGIPGFVISGTVLETRVTANPTTAASLKP